MKPAFSDKFRVVSNTVLRHRAMHLPFVEGLILNLANEDIGSSDRFIFDSGASISILNVRYKALFSLQKPVDAVRIQYGSGNSKTLDVYDAYFKKKQTKVFRIQVALDETLKTASLLGNHGFIDTFRSITLLPATSDINFTEVEV